MSWTTITEILRNIFAILFAAIIVVPFYFLALSLIENLIIKVQKNKQGKKQ